MLTFEELLKEIKNNKNEEWLFAKLNNSLGFVNLKQDREDNKFTFVFYGIDKEILVNKNQFTIL